MGRAWPCPSEQHPVSPSVSLSHQEASISLLSFSIRGQTDWKPQSQETNQSDHMDHSLSNSMKLWAMPCRPSEMDGSWWRVLAKCGPLEKGMAKDFSIFALRTPWTVWKGKKIWHWKMNSPGEQVPQYVTGDHWRNNSRKNREGAKAKPTSSCGCD